MRQLLIFLTGLLLSISYAYAYDYSGQRKYMRYTEKTKLGGNSFINQSFPSKIKRLSNNEGQIILSHDENLPDSIIVALEAAKKLWESRLPTKQPIFITALFEPLEPDVAMAVDLPLLEGGDLQGCPTALGSQLADWNFSDKESPDGFIVFNSLINWNCRFSVESDIDYNLPTMTLRGIARCLGFGSSIIEENPDYFSFCFSWPSYFDNLIFHDSKCLSSIKQGSQEMAKFVKSDNVLLKTISGEYQLYAPKQYIPYTSLCYLKDENSLMSHSLGKGSVSLDIDSKTLDVLRSIGWNFLTNTFEIKCDNISDNGIGSSYETHKFSLSSGSVNPSEIKWRFLLKNQLEEYVLVSSGNSEEFPISKVASPEDYYINVNGDLEGRIECDYTLNGIKYTATPFSLSLELKPIIHSIEEISIINENRYEFSLTFNVIYTGSDHLTVEVEEESNTSLRDYTFAEPYIAHVKTGRITNLDYSWVTVIATNQYGTAYETLEYSPVYRNLRESTNGYAPLESDNGRIIQILDLNGNLIYTGSSLNLNNQTFQKGIYIKKELYENGETQTSKIAM